MKYGIGLLLFFCFSCYAQHPFYYVLHQQADQSGYVLADPKGNPVIPGKYNWISVNNWGWIVALKDQKRTVFDSTGRLSKLGEIQAIIDPPVNASLIAVKKAGKWGFYNKAQELVLKPTFDEVSNFYKNKALVIQNTDTFFIDVTGRMLPTSFDKKRDKSFYILGGTENILTMEKMQLMYNDFASLKANLYMENGKTGLKSEDGSVLIKPEYDAIFNLFKEQVTVKLDDAYGVVDLQGEIILPMVYDEIYLMTPP